ncbi:MAG: AEC family transporter [Thermoanaerobaculia bacterium]
MNVHLSVVTSIVMLLALILLAMALRHRGLLHEEQGHTFSALVTKVTLPSLVFLSLLRSDLAWREAELALAMAVVTLACLALGWGLAAALRLERAQRGAVVLVSGFGSSSLLGFALVSRVFPADHAALGEAAILSGLGVQPLLFTLGVMIALYYGSEAGAATGRWSALRGYLTSPVFIAFGAGLLGGALRSGVQAGPVAESVLDAIQVAGAANTFLVTLAVGLMLHLEGLREVLGVLAGVAAIKLLAMPALLAGPAAGIATAPWQLDVLVLEGAMPSAMLSVVFCRSYGCDSRLAARLVLATTLLSAVTAPLVFEWLA